MKRRQFLQQSLAMAGLGVAGSGQNSWAASLPQADTSKKLIVVMLRGAVDGLSIVSPYAEADYAHQRPNIAIARPGEDNGSLALDKYFGLHPALGMLMPMWQSGRLGFVHAAGSPDPTRSHFDAQDYLESGTPGRKATADGWMNRLLTQLPGAGGPTRGISIGPTMPRIMSGTTPTANIASGASATKPSVLDRPQVGKAFDQMYKSDSGMSTAYQQAQDSHKEVMAASMDEETNVANRGATLPNGFPDDAARLARLMRKDANVQMAFMAVGGWDTHANQGNGKGKLANLLNPLGQGLLALSTELGSMLDDTCIVVMSEFGRTVRQNGNGGTDHGHGNVMWLLGGAIHGGKVHGDWQGLSDRALYEQRDLAVTTDFRSVLSEVLAKHMRIGDASLDKVFPGFSGHMTGVLRS